mgnify:CR=1 FL=1
MQRHVPLLLLLSACTQEAPYQELYDQGIDRYMGVFQPTATSEADGVVQNDFDPAQEDGPSAPMCYDGSPFRVMTQDRGSDNVVIFLQGGGLCTSELCLAIPTAPPGIPPLAVYGPIHYQELPELFMDFTASLTDETAYGVAVDGLIASATTAMVELVKP